MNLLGSIGKFAVRGSDFYIGNFGEFTSGFSGESYNMDVSAARLGARARQARKARRSIIVSVFLWIRASDERRLLRVLILKRVAQVRPGSWFSASVPEDVRMTRKSQMECEEFAISIA
jgi:hypothetical protein